MKKMKKVYSFRGRSNRPLAGTPLAKEMARPAVNAAAPVYAR